MRWISACRATLAAVLLSLAIAAPGQTTLWKVYEYSNDGFSAAYPSIPDLQKKNVETPAGTLEVRSYVAGAGDTEFMVGVCDYGSAAAEKNPDQILQGAKNSAIANSGSHLLNEKKISLGPNPGLQFEAENDATHITMRMYWVGSTLYETLVISPLNKPYEQTNKFLDSFQLVIRTNRESEE